MFAAPFLLLFGAFMALPILASFVMSFTDFGLANLTSPFDTAFVSLTTAAVVKPSARACRARYAAWTESGPTNRK